MRTILQAKPDRTGFVCTHLRQMYQIISTTTVYAGDYISSVNVSLYYDYYLEIPQGRAVKCSLTLQSRERCMPSVCNDW